MINSSVSALSHCRLLARIEILTHRGLLVSQLTHRGLLDRLYTHCGLLVSVWTNCGQLWTQSHWPVCKRILLTNTDALYPLSSIYHLIATARASSSSCCRLVECRSMHLIFKN